MNIQEHIPLAPYTTFKIGGNARYFCVVQNVDELKEARVFAEQKRVPLFILGGGSNILISDDGFPGLVIKNEIKGIFYEKQSDGKTLVTVGAGENWDTLVADTVARGLGGLENLSGIPGTVGASPVQNIGAYGAEVKDFIFSVTAIDQITGEQKVFSHTECELRYRHSFFKTLVGKKWVITQVQFLLDPSRPISIEYKDLSAFFLGKDTTKLSRNDVREAVLSIRHAKLPELSSFGTAGSFFKNVTISKEQYDDLKKKWPELPGFPLSTADSGLSTVKIPLAWILDNVCGFKGYRIGEVGVYKNQALVLINYGKGTASDIANLADTMRKKVYEMTGITIEPEVEYIFPEKVSR